MTAPRPLHRTRRLLALGLFLSILLHILGGALWTLLARTLARIVPKPVFMASLQTTPPPKTDTIRLERRPAAAARAAHENRPRTVARPQPEMTVAPALPLPKREIAHITAHAPPEPPAGRASYGVVRAPRHVRPVAVTAAPKNKPAYSDRQLVQLGAEFAQTIADSRETLGTVQAATEQAPVTTIRHYHLAFSGIHEGMNRGDGEITPISHQRIGNTMWYYARYTYLHADGTYEADNIPWPIHYPVNDDPFARNDKRVPIQPPPDGYKPDRPLKPWLAQYFGGPPVTD